MRLLPWLVLLRCVLSSLGQTTAATGQSKESKVQKPNVKKKVESAADVFPYQLPKEMIGDAMPDGDVMSYSRPGYASIYPSVKHDFQMFLHPPKQCQAVYLCFMKPPKMTTRGYSGLDFKSDCADSLRFLVMEQMVYQFKGGTATPYVYVSSHVYFTAKDNDGTFSVQVLADFDHEDIAAAATTEIQFSVKDKSILLLTSSPYCHTLIYSENKPTAGTTLRIEPDADMSDFYKVHNAPKPSPYVVSGSMSGSMYKSDGIRSEMYDIISKRKQESDEQCCPIQGLTLSMTAEEWNSLHFQAVANSYELTLNSEKYCKREKNALTSPLMSFVIEIGEECEWMRICFDKTKGKWCEKEGNILNLLLYHELFIPTDTDQAQPLAVGYGKIHDLRINFLYNEPAIEMAYAYASDKHPVVTHLMHLQAYEEVKMDPSKLFLHVVKEGRCRARLVTDESSMDFFGPPTENQCLIVSACECYEYH